MTIETILSRQAGVISRAQALATGASPSMINRRVASGAWMRAHPGIYLATDRELTTDTRLYAAILWAGPAATISGVRAAWWHGLWADSSAMIDLTVPQCWKRPARPGVRVRRRDLAPVDRVAVRGIWVTALPLTALEAAVELGRAASEAERSATAILRRAHIVGWQCDYRIGEYQTDIVFPASKLVIEFDGWMWHSDVPRFRHAERSSWRVDGPAVHLTRADVEA